MQRKKIITAVIAIILLLTCNTTEWLAAESTATHAGSQFEAQLTAQAGKP